jgi:hypothetical protein
VTGFSAPTGHLASVCGQIEELATTWRREHTSGTSRRQLPLAFPHHLQSAARQLAATLQALVEAGAGPDPDLASSAAAQLAALQAMSLPLAATAAAIRARQRAAVTPAPQPWPASSRP